MKLAMLLGGILLMVCASVARADFVVSASVDGGAPSVIADDPVSAGPVLFNGPLGAFNVTIFGADSNSPGGASLADEFSASVEIQNTGSTSHTLEFFIGSQGFTLPVTPPSLTLLSHISGTVAVGSASNSLSFTSCVDPTNSTSPCPSAIESGTGTPGITTAGSFANDQSATIASLAATYSIGEDLFVDLGAGAQINFSASTTLTPAVPEPVSVGWMAGGIVLLAGIYKRARRAKQV